MTELRRLQLIWGTCPLHPGRPKPDACWTCEQHANRRPPRQEPKRQKYMRAPA